MQPLSRREAACAEMLVALELSKKTWIVAVYAPASAKISQYRLTGGDGQRLLELIERLRLRAVRAAGTEITVASCYEAGYDGFWLHRLLVARGITNHVIDPASIHVSRRARRAKTDRLDAEMLVRVLLAHRRGERKVCSMVRVPTVEEEDRKRQHRERERLVGARTAHVLRIKGLLATQGIRDANPLRSNWPGVLETLRTGDGHPMAACLRNEVLREWQRLRLVVDMIAAVERERDQDLADTELAGPAEAKIGLLQRLRGIGPSFATVLTREVFYRRFANRREVGSYVGLAPTPFNSGATRRDQGISKAGNPRARATAIELAWLWLRHQPESALAGWFRTRTNGLQGRMRKITIVAMARKLVVALWRYLETGVVPTGAVFKV